MLLFGLAILAGSLTMSSLVAVANDGDDRNNKREPVRDDPGPVTEADLPAGQHLGTLTEPLVWGEFLIYPAGQQPGFDDEWGSNEGWSWATFSTAPEDTSATGLIVDASAIPFGYRVDGGGGTRATSPTGVTEVVEAGIALTGAGYPITVTRAKTPDVSAGRPFIQSVPSPGGLMMMTLGKVKGTPAVFLHRSPGTVTVELQQVRIPVGGQLLLVEGYVDEFEKLIRITESVLDNFEAPPPAKQTYAAEHPTPTAIPAATCSNDENACAVSRSVDDALRRDDLQGMLASLAPRTLRCSPPPTSSILLSACQRAGGEPRVGFQMMTKAGLEWLEEEAFVSRTLAGLEAVPAPRGVQSIGCAVAEDESVGDCSGEFALAIGSDQGEGGPVVVLFFTAGSTEGVLGAALSNPPLGPVSRGGRQDEGWLDVATGTVTTKYFWFTPIR
ncbi:MAG: hypothetical protein ACSLFM_09840 [Tepidiformaceae bacterium]